MKKSKQLKILFYDILTGDAAVRSAIEEKVYGGSTYSESMRVAFGLKSGAWQVVDASRNANPSLSGIEAVVMGGSVEDPIEGAEKPWMEGAYQFIRNCAQKKIPMLGICGGLQFTVRALGGTVIYNPRGREFGSVVVTLNRKGMSDGLFRGLKNNIVVQESHKCMASGLKPEWELLGSSKLCEFQAIAIGDRIRLLQFHPEMSATQLKIIARMRKETLLKEGFVKNEPAYKKFLLSVRRTRKIGKKILENFLNLTNFNKSC